MPKPPHLDESYTDPRPYINSRMTPEKIKEKAAAAVVAGEQRLKKTIAEIESNIAEFKKIAESGECHHPTARSGNYSGDMQCHICMTFWRGKMID